MPYTMRIDRQNPGCFIFLIDQSSSMADPFGSTEVSKSKADCVADVMNRLLQNIVIACAGNEGIRNYFDVGVIGYSEPAQHRKRIGPAFSGPLAGQALVPIAQIADNPARIEERMRQVPDGAGGLVSETVKFPIWFDSVAEGGTPMCEALQYVYQLLPEWVADHPHSYPPIVIHITDGEATDGNPESYAEGIKKLATEDGNVLLFNCHISSRTGAPIMFPDREEGLPDKYAQLLFHMSSVLPENMRQEAQKQHFAVGELARGFAFKADFVELVRFLGIGTQVDLR